MAVTHDARLAAVAAAARAVETAPPRNRADALATVVDAFDRLHRSWTIGGALPTHGAVRAALVACGTGAARLVPLTWGRQNFVHQFLTKEYVDALAAYIAATRFEPVVEVGAGRGDLARALVRRGVEVRASDDGSWLDGRLHWPVSLPAGVLRQDYVAALGSARPALVICAWMPTGEDWTPAFRACPSVKAYLLLGEARGGATGAPQSFDTPAPWTGEELPAISRWSITRNVDGGAPPSTFAVRR